MFVTEECGLYRRAVRCLSIVHKAVVSLRMKPYHGFLGYAKTRMSLVLTSIENSARFCVPLAQAKCMARGVEMQLSRIFADVALRGVRTGGKERLSVVADRFA